MEAQLTMRRQPMCLKAKGHPAVACGSGGARGQGWLLTDPAGCPSVAKGPSEAMSQGLHSTSGANPGLTSV